MKALFALKNVSTGKVLEEPTFENKLEAKARRDKVWENKGKPMTKPQSVADLAESDRVHSLQASKPNFSHVVTYGPDHDKFQS